MTPLEIICWTLVALLVLWVIWKVCKALLSSSSTGLDWSDEALADTSFWQDKFLQDDGSDSFDGFGGGNSGGGGADSDWGGDDD